MKVSMRSASKPYDAGSCQRNGPVVVPSASTPLARKLAKAPSARRSFRLCVMNRLPLFANTNPRAGTSRAQRSNTAGDLRL